VDTTDCSGGEEHITKHSSSQKYFRCWGGGGGPRRQNTYELKSKSAEGGVCDDLQLELLASGVDLGGRKRNPKVSGAAGNNNVGLG